MHHIQRTHNMRYNIAKRLSSGAFGTVYGVIGEDNNKYALKELKNFDKTNKGRFEREIKILSQLNHRNIVKIIQWNIGGDPLILDVLLDNNNIWKKSLVMDMFLEES